MTMTIKIKEFLNMKGEIQKLNAKLCARENEASQLNEYIEAKQSAWHELKSRNNALTYKIKELENINENS